MAQVDVYSYAEIVKSDGTKIKIGSKNKPVVVTLTGTGEILNLVYNDVTGPVLKRLYTAELTEPIKWFAVKSTVAGNLLWGENSVSSSSVLIAANSWHFVYGGTNTVDAATITARATESSADITNISFYVASGAADIEFIAVY